MQSSTIDVDILSNLEVLGSSWKILEKLETLGRNLGYRFLNNFDPTYFKASFIFQFFPNAPRLLSQIHKTYLGVVGCGDGFISSYNAFVG